MTQQPGWYDDPKESDLLRYWDGVQWTTHTSPRRRPHLDQTSRNMGSDGGGNASTGGAYGSGSGVGGAQGYAGQSYGGAAGGYQPMPGGRFEPTSGAPRTPDGYQIAGWWRRFFARVIDYILVALVSLLLIPLVAPDLITSFRAFLDVAIDTSSTQADLDAAQLNFVAKTVPFGLASAVLGLVYETVFLRLRAGTPGKLVLGLRVRRRGEDGPLQWSSSAIRALVWHGPSLLGAVPFLGLITFFFPFVNGLWPLWDSQNQSLNDKGAKTHVIKV